MAYICIQSSLKISFFSTCHFLVVFSKGFVLAYVNTSNRGKGYFQPSNTKSIWKEEEKTFIFITKVFNLFWIHYTSIDLRVQAEEKALWFLNDFKRGMSLFNVYFVLYWFGSDTSIYLQKHLKHNLAEKSPNYISFSSWIFLRSFAISCTWCYPQGPSLFS